MKLPGKMQKNTQVLFQKCTEQELLSISSTTAVEMISRDSESHTICFDQTVKRDWMKSTSLDKIQEESCTKLQE